MKQEWNPPVEISQTVPAAHSQRDDGWHPVEGPMDWNGFCWVQLSDGSVHMAWYAARKDLFTTPDGGEGFDPIFYIRLDEPKPFEHVCDGVDGAERHGTSNRCSICGEYRSGKKPPYIKEPK